jgi:predicted phosphodiesterase
MQGTIETKRFSKRILIILAGLCGIIFALGSVGFWKGYQADKNAGMMRSHGWIHNERCLKKIANSPNPDVFKFAVFGDIQIGTAQLPRLIEVLKEKAPVAFVVQTGDAVSHADLGHYNLFLNGLARSGLSLPMFVVPGNHDVRNDPENLFEHYFGPKQLWFKYGKSLFILLDNALGVFEDVQYRWLEDVLEKHKVGTQHIFLFMHVPPINWKDSGDVPREHLYERFFELLKRYKVDYVFTGDWHGYHRQARDGTIFVVNGRGGDFDHDAKLVPCYTTVVEIQRDSVQDRCIELAPRVSIVLESLFQDWFTAHIGEFAMKNQWFYSGLLLLVGSGCVFFVIRSKSANMRGPLKLQKNRRGDF